MADVTYPLFPILAFLGFILSLIPLPWHLHAWNSGTCYYMIWASLACLNQFINSVVWHANALNPAPAWCEISIRVMMGATVGLPLSSLCITRRLYHITSSQTVSISRAQKSRAILIDTALCVGVPIIFIALQYVVQGHRFNIYEDVGCFPAVVNTRLTFFLSYLWPVVIGLISAVFCVLSLRAFARRRLEFSQFMRSNTSSLTMGRYFRLMALASTEILLTTPLAIFSMWINTAAYPVQPWVSWSDTHFNYSRVEQIPAFFWTQNHLVVLGIEFTRYTPILCALIFFAFFGFADEAKKNYRLAFWWVAGRFGVKRVVEKPAGGLPTIGHYQKPKLPATTASFAPSSQLPPYSPDAPSYYPMGGVKKGQTDKCEAATDDGASHFDSASTASIVQHEHDESPRRYSWRTIILPTTSRRYSSYI